MKRKLFPTQRQIERTVGQVNERCQDEEKRRNQRKKKSNFLLVDSFTTFFDWQKDVLTQLRRKVTYNLIPMLRRLPSPWHIQTQQQALLETHIKSSTVDRQRQVKATHKEYTDVSTWISAAVCNVNWRSKCECRVSNWKWLKQELCLHSSTS